MPPFFIVLCYKEVIPGVPGAIEQSRLTFMQIDAPNRMKGKSNGCIYYPKHLAFGRR